MKGKSKENTTINHLSRFIFLPEKLIVSIKQFFLNGRKKQSKNLNIRKIDDYGLSVDDYFHKKDILQVRIQVKGTRAVFDIPLQELAVDFNILSQIDPLELIQIGYCAKEEEIKRNQKLISNANKGQE